MKSKLAGLAGLVASLVVYLHPAPADACGVKLTVKTSAPRKAVARTSSPSHVLLVGRPPTRLKRDLSAAGHNVEVAQDPAAAKRETYAVVIVDSNEQAGPAKSRFSNAVVLVRSGDVVADMRTVENQVARKPVGADSGRTIVAARPARQPIAAGPERVQPVAGGSEAGGGAVVAPPRTTEPTRTAVREEKPAVREEKPAVREEKVVREEKPAREEKPVREEKPERVATDVRKTDETAPQRTASSARAAASPNAELYFTLGSSNIASYKSRLAKTVAWLTNNPDTQVVVEGHADPTGNADANMALSQTRAESVRDYLVSAGIDSSRIEVVPFGDTKLKYGRTDRRNRRVAIEAKK